MTECPQCGSDLRNTRRPVPWTDALSVPCSNEWHDVDQLELDIAPLVKPPHVEGQTIQERFLSFHKLNPTVYVALERLVREWIAAGHDKVGMKMMFEVLRWRHGMSTQGDIWRLNNSYTSRYARLMLDSHPEWETVLETRELKAA